MQLHAKGFQVVDGGVFLRVAAQQADGGKTKAFPRCRQRMQVIGIRTAQADDAVGAVRLGQVPGELEPLVAADQRVDTVQP